MTSSQKLEESIERLEKAFLLLQNENRIINNRLEAMQNSIFERSKLIFSMQS
jgi:chaperonin cofactor prefoldin